MSRSGFARGCVMAVLLALAGSAQSCWGEIVLEEQRKDVVARVVIDRSVVELSGEVTLVLTVEGPGRIEVAPPRPLLTKATALSWRVRELVPHPVELRSTGRSVWKQEFQLAPFEVGSEVTIELMPLKVKAGNEREMEITWSKTAGIEVTTSIREANPQLLRPSTGIELLPPPPPLFTPRPKPMMLVGLAISLVLIVGAFVLIVLRRKKPEAMPLSNAARALRDLADLRGRATGIAADFVRITEVLRRYLDERHQIPAIRLTTPEVLTIIERNLPMLAAIHSPLRDLLDRCDVAKFAGALLESGECVDCIDRASALVEQIAAMDSNQPSV